MELSLSSRSSPHDDDYGERKPDTENQELGRARQHQLSRWIQEDRLAGDMLCARTFQLWRADVIARLTAQSKGPLLLPRDVKLPRCLVAVRGLSSQKVRLTADGSVKILVYVQGIGDTEGMELVPAND